MVYLNAVQQIALARTCVVLDALAANPTAQPINEAAIGLLFSDVYGRGIVEADVVDWDAEFIESANALALDLEMGPACLRPTLGLISEELKKLLAGSPEDEPVERVQTGGKEKDTVGINLQEGLKRVAMLFGGGDLSGFQVIDRSSKGKPTAPLAGAVRKLKGKNPMDRLLTLSPSKITELEFSSLLDGLNRKDQRAKNYLERNLPILLDRAGREGGSILWFLANIDLCFKIRGLLSGLQKLQLGDKPIRECERDFTALMSLQALAGCGNLQAEALLRKLGKKKGSVAEEFLEDLPLHQLAFRYVAHRNPYDLLTLTELAKSGNVTARVLLESVSNTDQRKPV